MYNETHTIMRAINNGESLDKYEEWSNHPDPYVRYTLAINGHFPDKLIKDKNEDVREGVIATHPDYLPYLLHDEALYERVNLILEKQVYPDIDLLEQHIEDLKTFNSEFYREDMEIKLAALKHKATPIELTMTPLQLYKANSPLWALHLTPEDISYLKDAPDAFKSQENWLEKELHK